jgi:hypothetical protein
VPGEIDDQVHALARRHEQRRGISRGAHRDRSVEQSTVGADLPHRDVRGAGGGSAEVELIEARVRGVDDAEPIAPWLDAEVGPALAVHHDHVAEELGRPVRMDPGFTPSVGNASWP